MVLSVSEVKSLLAECRGDASLPAALMYGSGLRAMECLRLCVGDLDMTRRTIRVHAGKGGKDRVTVLPERLAFFAPDVFLRLNGWKMSVNARAAHRFVLQSVATDTCDMEHLLPGIRAVLVKL